mmetsp:Transcript_24630/g.35332  ORF Transcript_24630/g.35332 Transcript_24630/m.35332 type:complete len:805 (-) Transcript_24630:551-2965(-)
MPCTTCSAAYTHHHHFSEPQHAGGVEWTHMDVEAARGVVVQEEERLGPAHQDVVDAHGHQVHADAAVLPHGLRDHQLRAHPVGAGHQHGVVAPEARLRQVEEAPEAAQLGVAARPNRGLAVRLDAGHQLLARVDVHAGRLVGQGLCLLLLQYERGVQESHGLHEGGALQLLHPLLQVLRRVSGQHRAAPLQQQGPAVQLLRHPVDAAAALPVSRRQHCPVHLQVHASREPGQQRRVHVEAAALPATHELGGGDAHEAHHQHQVHARLLQPRGHHPVKGLAAQAFCGHPQVRQAVPCGSLQDAGLCLVGQHQTDLGRQLPRLDGVDDGLQGGAAGGAQHAQPDGPRQSPLGDVSAEVHALEADRFHPAVGRLHRGPQTPAHPGHGQHPAAARQAALAIPARSCAGVVHKHRLLRLLRALLTPHDHLPPRGVLTRVTLRSQHHGAGRGPFRPLHQRALARCGHGQGVVRAREHDGEEVFVPGQQRQQHLCLGVAEPAVELQQAGTLSGQHEPRVQHALVGPALPGHAVHRPLHDGQAARVLVRGEQRGGRVGPHAARVGAQVGLLHPLMILGGRHAHGDPAVAEGQQRHLRARQALLHHHLPARAAQLALQQHGPHGLHGLLLAGGQHHSLAGRQTRRLDHEFVRRGQDVLLGLGAVREGPVQRGGQAVAGHELLGPRLGALQLRGPGRGTETQDVLLPQHVRQSVHQRLLRPHHHQRHLLLPGEAHDAGQVVRGDGHIPALRSARSLLALLPQQMGPEVAWTHRDPPHQGTLQQAYSDGMLSAAATDDHHVIAAVNRKCSILQCC